MRFVLSFLFSLVSTAACAENVAIYGSDQFGTVIVIPSDDEYQVAAKLIIAAGAAEDGAREGMAHFAEHRAFVGAMLATGYRGSINAFTMLQTTEFYTLTDPGSLNYVIGFFEAVLSNEPIPEAAFETERTRILREIEDASNKPITSQERCAARMIIFANAPWRNCVLGQFDVFNALTADDVRAFQSEYYTPDRSVLVIAGSVDLVTVQTLIPPKRAPRWLAPPLADPVVNPAGSPVSTGIEGRLFLGYNVIDTPGSLTSSEQSALVMFASIWSLEELRTALSEALTESTFVARNFNVLIEPLGSGMVLATINAELERGMTADMARSAITKAIGELREPDRNLLLSQRAALADHAAQPSVYHQLLLVHLSHRLAPLTLPSLREAFEALPLDTIQSLTRAIYSPDSWQFISSR